MGTPGEPSPLSIWHYDLRKWNFVPLVRKAIHEPDLYALRGDELQVVTRETDQSTTWHSLFYENFGYLAETYENFVLQVIGPRIGEPFYYQRVPSFRVQLPKNRAVGEFHCDRDYGHPDGEVNFWLPLTDCGDSSAIKTWGTPETLKTFNLEVGDVLEFDAVNTLHGNSINETLYSRVSMDFRVMPVSQYRKTNRQSVNMGLRFEPGAYYAWDAVTP